MNIIYRNGGGASGNYLRYQMIASNGTVATTAYVYVSSTGDNNNDGLTSTSAVRDFAGLNNALSRLDVYAPLINVQVMFTAGTFTASGPFVINNHSAAACNSLTLTGAGYTNTFFDASSSGLLDFQLAVTRININNVTCNAPVRGFDNTYIYIHGTNRIRNNGTVTNVAIVQSMLGAFIDIRGTIYFEGGTTVISSLFLAQSGTIYLHNSLTISLINFSSVNVLATGYLGQAIYSGHIITRTPSGNITGTFPGYLGAISHGGVWDNWTVWNSRITGEKAIQVARNGVMLQGANIPSGWAYITISGGVPTASAGTGVMSITRNATGDHTVLFNQTALGQAYANPNARGAQYTVTCQGITSPGMGARVQTYTSGTLADLAFYVTVY